MTTRTSRSLDPREKEILCRRPKEIVFLIHQYSINLLHKQLSGVSCVLRNRLREGVKKKGKKAVRLTAWVDPPSPSPEAVRKM